MAVKRVEPKKKETLLDSKTEKVYSEPLVTGIIKSQRKIGIQKGIVVNMGNYESFRITIWQERYCDDTKEASNKVLAEISDELDELLEAEVDAVKGAK